MSSTLKIVLSLLTAIVTANLISMSKKLKNFITKLSPNYTKYNLPGFEVIQTLSVFLQIFLSSTLYRF